MNGTQILSIMKTPSNDLFQPIGSLVSHSGLEL